MAVGVVRVAVRVVCVAVGVVCGVERNRGE